MKAQQKFERLTDEDKATLKRNAWLGSIFPGVIMLFIGFIALAFLTILQLQSYAWLSVGIVVMIVGVTIFFKLKRVEFLSQYPKTIITGLISERFEKLGGQTNSHNVGGQGLRNVLFHHLTIESRTLRVPKSIYKRYKVGDAVELHLIEVSGSLPIPAIIRHGLLKH